MSRPRAPGIPGWLAFANRYSPLVQASAVDIVECEWLHEDARTPDVLATYTRGGWVDVYRQRGRARLYLAVARFCDLLVDGGLDLGDEDDDKDLRVALDDVWATCVRWFHLSANPLRPGTWPPWLAALNVGNRVMRAPGGSSPRTRFYAVRPAVRTDIGTAERVLAEIAAELLHDASVLTSPSVRFARFAYCEGCGNLFIRGHVTADAESSSGSPHTYCHQRCGRITRREQKAAQARAHAAKAEAELQATLNARLS